MGIMAKEVIHVSDKEAASDFASLLARVREGEGPHGKLTIWRCRTRSREGLALCISLILCLQAGAFTLLSSQDLV